MVQVKTKKVENYQIMINIFHGQGHDFSGKISYKLDNGENILKFIEILIKKNPKIYNEQKEEITNKFNIDKSTGNQFFYEQTKVDEDLFLSTVVSNQQEVKLGKNRTRCLIQKLQI